MWITYIERAYIPRRIWLGKDVMEVLYTIVLFLLAMYLSIVIGATMVGLYTGRKLINEIFPERTK